MTDDFRDQNDDLPHFIDDPDDETPSFIKPTAREWTPDADRPLPLSDHTTASQTSNTVPSPETSSGEAAAVPVTDPVLEEDILRFLQATSPQPEAEAEPAYDFQPTPPDPPAPETQSAFVNPALARIASARPRRPQRDPSEWWLGLRTIFIVTGAAVIAAFIFNYWTPDSFLSKDFIANLQVVSSTQGPPTAVPSPLPTFESVQRVGIIIGHSGPPLNPAFTEDPGAICDENNDGIPELRELDINTAVGIRVANLLVSDGYLVDILNEWDERITNYRGAALVSIHTNTCENLGFGATGFNVQANETHLAFTDRDAVLVDCIVNAYAARTALPRHFGRPPDLVDYHAFREVSVDTPTVIVELGFMFADRQVLTTQTELMAAGIFEGLKCFLEPQSQFVPTVPPPTPASG